MGRAAQCLDVEARDGVAARGDAAPVDAGFGHQHGAGAGRLGLDQIAAGRGADFLVRGEQDGDRQLGFDPRARQLADGFEAEVIAALHVHDAGAVALVALALERQGVQRADRVHRVEMAHDQDAGFAHPRVGKARAHAIAAAHAAGDAFHHGAHQREVPRGDVHHAVHRAGVPGGAFAFDPWAQAGEHFVGVEREGGDVHGDSSLVGARLRSIIPQRSGARNRGAPHV